MRHRKFEFALTIIFAACLLPQELPAAQAKKLRLAFSALASGVLTPPTSTMAAKLGYREIFDLASLEFPFPVISVVSTRRFIAANPDVILNILKATAEAIHLYKTRPELTIPVVAKYMRVPREDPALVQSQQSLGVHMNQNLAPSLAAIKFVLDFLAEKQPGLKSKNPADFVDVRFLRKLEEEGFFRNFQP
jgi:NitT/TauT family transport system substrate-binding protein